MTAELQLAEFVTGIQPTQVATTARKTAQRVLMASVGAGIAAAREEGIAELYSFTQTKTIAVAPLGGRR